MKKVICFLSNVQIQSALLWAIVILACAFISREAAIMNILVTAAGFHVVLLSTKFGKNKKRSEAKG